LPGAPWEGRKEGRSAGGGEGEGDKCLKVLGIDASAAFDWVFVFADRDASELEEESDESESESESESELDCLGSDVGRCADSLLEDESDSEEEEDSELETAALLFRFLVLFLGSGGIQGEGSPNLGLGVQFTSYEQTGSPFPATVPFFSSVNTKEHQIQKNK